MAKRGFELRVVTYNLLSSSLSPKSHFINNNPNHLNPKNRIKKIFGDKILENNSFSKNKNEEFNGKLMDEINNYRSIICLQELSQDWENLLHPFFLNYGYNLITARYGRFFNGYMGVAIAYPMEDYELIECDISRIADDTFQINNWPERPKYNKNTLNKVWDWVKWPFESLSSLIIAQKEDEYKVYEETRWKNNLMLSLLLKSIDSEKLFNISTYHMPCSWRKPQLMSLHSSLSAKHAQKIRRKYKKKDIIIPSIFCGDFNIKPSSPQYELITRGTMDIGSPDYPKFPENEKSNKKKKWDLFLDEPFNSAYEVALGHEPEFTNYSQTVGMPPFKDTLDYIFITPDIHVIEVLDLELEKITELLPNEDEPSDHLLLAATLRI